MSLVKRSFGDGPTRSSSHLRCLRPLPVPQTYRVLIRTMWPPPLHRSTAPPVQFDWAGKRATRVGRGPDASSQPIWADKRLFLKWDEWLQQPHLTRHNHVAQRLCTWGTWYKPSVLASPAEWRCYPPDTSGGRPLTEAMISYPERASAVDGDVNRII